MCLCCLYQSHTRMHTIHDIHDDTIDTVNTRQPRYVAGSVVRLRMYSQQNTDNPERETTTRIPLYKDEAVVDCKIHTDQQCHTQVVFSARGFPADGKFLLLKRIFRAHKSKAEEAELVE